MKAPLSWLQDMIDLKDIAVEELARRLTMSGLEVSGITGENKETVLELEITPNRPDALSLAGIARDLGVLFKKTVKTVPVELRAEVVDHGVVSITDPDGCPRYAGLLIEGVTVKASPAWLSDRLIAAGLRPINNIVDITNYVMLECGHPMHAFDFDTIKGRRIIVRAAATGEKILLLDNTELKLTGGEVVIADQDRPVALAGVMGGSETAVQDHTKDIFLECAFFNPVRVRKTVQRHHVHTDSSYRFERGVDINGIIRAICRAADLVLSCAGGRVTGPINDILPNPAAAVGKKIIVRQRTLRRVAGTDIEHQEVNRILSGLGFLPQPQTDGWQVTSPAFRPDVEGEMDIIEEILRIFGYENLDYTLPYMPRKPVDGKRFTEPSDWYVFRGGLRELALAAGYHEAVTTSFIAPSLAEKFGKPYTELSNSLSDEERVMRNTLCVNLLRVLNRNINSQDRPAAFFEIGRVFVSDGQGRPSAADAQGRAGAAGGEKTHLAIALGGIRQTKEWYNRGDENYDLYDIKAFVARLQETCGVPITLEYREVDFLEKGMSFALVSGKTLIGYAGQVEKNLARSLEARVDNYICECDIEFLKKLKPGSMTYQPIRRFPAVNRDLALVLPEAVSAGTVIDRVRAASIKNLDEIRVFDYYQGGNIEKGRKSLGFSFRFSNQSRTLTEDEVQVEIERIIALISAEFKAVQR